jgi:iron complex transport system substrate-binding protein
MITTTKSSLIIKETIHVVSLLPSATECLGWILLNNTTTTTKQIHFVGRSHECDWPEDLVRNVPMLTKPKIIDSSTTSAKEIDEQVRAIMNNESNTNKSLSSSLYELNEKKLNELQPDVILTQSLCEVCSVSLDQVTQCVGESLPNCHIVSLNPKTLLEVIHDLLIIGQAIGLEDVAQIAVNQLQTRINQVRTSSTTHIKKPNILMMEWTDPIFIGGHWNPELISLAGGIQQLNPRIGQKSFVVSDDEVSKSDPDFIIVACCGMGLTRTREMIHEIENHPTRSQWWKSLRAVQQHHVVICDGNIHFNRPGPRLVEALEFLSWLFNNKVANELSLLEQRKVYDGIFPWEVL